MKKLTLISLVLLSFFACKTQEFSPEGPTDVRVKNISALTLTMVIVNTSGGIDTLGNIAAGATSAYFRFDKAFPRAEVKATVNGEVFSTGPVNYNAQTYIGQAKITYTVQIKSIPDKTLEITDVSLDAPLD